MCFTSEHRGSFSGLSAEQARTVIDAWADRTSELGAIDSIEYVFCFENRGEEIGVTLSHPHGQIYGYPFVPPRFYRVGESLHRHREKFGTCLQCELLEAELKAEIRVVSQTEHWVSHVPFAARWPYEVRIVPREHVPDLPALSDEQRDDLAAMYLDVLRRFDALFDGAGALHRRLAAGAGAPRARAVARGRRDLHDPARAREAEIPGRLGVGGRGLDQRRHARKKRRSGCAMRSL